MPKRGSKEWRKNISNSLKGRTVWNKGLTKADVRVEKYISKNKALFKKGQHSNPATEFKKGLKPWNLGKPQSEEVKRKIGLANSHPRPENLGTNNPMYKKDRNVSYTQKHRIVRKELEDIKNCQKCGSNYDLEISNVSGRYLLHISDWQKLCSPCHRKYDNVVKNFKK